LKFYTLAFGLDGAEGKIYFNFSRDIFVYEEGFASQMKFDRCRDLKKVQHLALHCSFLEDSILDSILKLSMDRWRNRRNRRKQLYFFQEADSNIHQTHQDVAYGVQDVNDEDSQTQLRIRKLEEEDGVSVKLVLFRGMRGPSVTVEDESEGE
jgi:hypothetical protein